MNNNSIYNRKGSRPLVRESRKTIKSVIKNIVFIGMFRLLQMAIKTTERRREFFILNFIVINVFFKVILYCKYRFF